MARWQLLPGEPVTPRLDPSPALVAVTKFLGLHLDFCLLSLHGNVFSTCAGVGWSLASLLQKDALFRFGEVHGVLDVGEHSGGCAVTSVDPKFSISAGVNPLLYPDVVRYG